MLRAVGLLALALLLLGCGGSGEGGADDSLYHLERQLQGPAPDGTLSCGPPQERCPFHEGRPEDVLRYEPRGEPPLGSDDFLRESARADGPHVTVTFTPEGGRRFHSLTRAIAEAGRTEGRPQSVAIVVGDEIVGFASIDPEQYPDGMTAETPGTTFVAASADEAERLAARLRGG